MCVCGGGGGTLYTLYWHHNITDQDHLNKPGHQFQRDVSCETVLLFSPVIKFSVIVFTHNSFDRRGFENRSDLSVSGEQTYVFSENNNSCVCCGSCLHLCWHKLDSFLGLGARKPVFGSLQTAQAQTSLCIREV